MKIFELLHLIDLEIRHPNSRNPIRESLLWGLIISCFLIFFRPFGISNNDIFRFLATCLGYGFITFTVMFFSLRYIKKILFRLFKNKWTIKYELLLLFLIILQTSLLNYLFATLILEDFRLSFLTLIRVFLYSSSLLALIFLFKNAFVLFLSYSAEKAKLETKLEYFREIKDYSESAKNRDTLKLFYFENEEQELQLDRIALFSAWGNYIKILMDTDTGKVELVKRGRIKDIEDQLADNTGFQKCHRSYIVNTNYIRKIRGNSKKAYAILKLDDISVPVAREKIKSFTTKFPG